MSFPGHPFPSEPHPWTDPLAPADPAAERPDWAIQMAGALAPSPDSFSFDERGRQEYYAAVRTTALMIEQQRSAAMTATAQRHHVVTTGDTGDPSPTALLLLLP